VPAAAGVAAPISASTQLRNVRMKKRGIPVSQYAPQLPASATRRRNVRPQLNASGANALTGALQPEYAGQQLVGPQPAVIAACNGLAHRLCRGVAADNR